MCGRCNFRSLWHTLIFKAIRIDGIDKRTGETVKKKRRPKTGTWNSQSTLESGERKGTRKENWGKMTTEMC